MKRDEATSRLQQHEADLKRLGVEHLYMVGSTARGEANDDSDVDLFFDYEKGKLGLFELMDVKKVCQCARKAAALIATAKDFLSDLFAEQAAILSRATFRGFFVSGCY
jgi:predicted nucleotidyltransferase